MKKFGFILVLFVFFCNANSQITGNVIFIHPDGTSISQYNAARMLYYGPDGRLNWDKMTNQAVYLGHMLDGISATSNSGATVHAFGEKVLRASYGKNGKEILFSASGKPFSIMKEAMMNGIKTGLVNSGSIIEPGTGCFVAQTDSRYVYEEITKQVVESGADVILSGGEEWFLPEGVSGVHTKSGRRKDNLNLVETARQRGYAIVYDKDELADLHDTVTKVIGIFAEKHTFNDFSEEELAGIGLPNYKKSAPTVKEMTEAAIKILSKNNFKFFLVVEEEGTDNFANRNNANATLEAMKRADDAIGYVMDFINQNPNTLLLTTADSDAGGMQVLGITDDVFKNFTGTLPEKFQNLFVMDGTEGTGTKPFYTSPDKFGSRLPFAVLWASDEDMHGSMLAKAYGLNSDKMTGTIDNTYIFRLMYLTLFGIELN
ncbi:MAG: alkaline phosphatase [Ignavibacteria bacterium]|nr:alkaline phosphatase [Ignavibacteria bacterium]